MTPGGHLTGKTLDFTIGCEVSSKHGHSENHHPLPVWQTTQAMVCLRMALEQVQAPTMKPKEALVKDGFLPAGSENKRGRLSADAIERCKVLVTQGWDIEGYAMASPPVPMETAGAMAAQVAKVKTDPNAVVDIPNPTRDESAMTAWSGTVSVGMRTVCNNCRRSLTYCPCEQPRVWLDHETQGVVHFKAKG